MGTLRKTFKDYYRNTRTGKYLLQPAIWFRDRLLPKKYQAMLAFRRILGYPLDLKDPQTFNEKIQWLKLHRHRALQTRLADKFEVRTYVANKLGEEYLIPLVFQSYSVDDLKPGNFPDVPFILKTNHDSSGGIIIRNKDHVDWSKLSRQFNKRLQTNYYHVNGEMQYRDIRPCLIAEELLQDETGGIPYDFKLHCFNGKVQFIQVDLDRDLDHKRNMYNTDWELQDFRYVYENGRDLPRPDRLPEMIRLAETIAEEFDFVRIDFYDIGSQIFFGEVTFHPESGLGRFYPQDWDLHWGSLLKINPA